MFTTVDTKSTQLRNGFTRSGTGSKTVLVVGSCRVIPHFNFLSDVNPNNSLSIYFIDPFYWNYDEKDNRVDLFDNLHRLEQHPQVLEVIKNAEWFVHEHYANYEMFNTDKSRDKTIYQFGMSPKIDLCIPNYNDLFILFQEIVNYHHEFRPAARRELIENGKLSEGLQRSMAEYGRSEISKFIAICGLSSFPKFAKFFQDNWTKTRLFWTMNHVTANFTIELFELIAKRLGLVTTPELKAKWHKEDPYTIPVTRPTQYDVDNYGLSWSEPIAKLKTPPE